MTMYQALERVGRATVDVRTSTCPADDKPFLDLVAGLAGLAVSRAAEFAAWVRHVVDKFIGDDFAGRDTVIGSSS